MVWDVEVNVFGTIRGGVIGSMCCRGILEAAMYDFIANRVFFNIRIWQGSDSIVSTID